MVKGLGAFIDHVGRTTGRMIGQILSDKDDEGDIGEMVGDIIDLPDDVQGLPDFEDCKDIVVVKIDDDE